MTFHTKGFNRNIIKINYKISNLKTNPQDNSLNLIHKHLTGEKNSELSF